MRPISLLAICLLVSPIYAQTDLRENLEQVIQELKMPNEFGLAILPDDTKLFDYKIEEEELNILFQLSFDFLYREMSN